MLELKNIHIKAGKFEINDLSICVEQGDYYVMLGQSGAGKSLILKAICGIIPIASGEIWLNEKRIDTFPSHKRNIGIVPQSLALFSHLSVFENIAYSLKSSGLKASEIKKRVSDIAQEFDIENLMNRNTQKLSGGEQQRVALGRTLAYSPDIILLDEPLSSVDVGISNEIMSLLRKINRTGQTIIHVTHQYEEALALATKIAIVESGKIIQNGTPQAVFSNPNSQFVANLSGIENFYSARIIAENKAIIGEKIEITLPISDIGRRGFVMFHSHDVIVSEHPISSSMTNNFEGKIIDISNCHAGVNLTIDAGFKVQASILEITRIAMSLNVGSTVWVHFKATAVKFI